MQKNHTYQQSGKGAGHSNRNAELERLACVASCPTKVLVLVDVDDIPSEKRKRLVLEEAGKEA